MRDLTDTEPEHLKLEENLKKNFSRKSHFNLKNRQCTDEGFGFKGQCLGDILKRIADIGTKAAGFPEFSNYLKPVLDKAGSAISKFF